MADVKCQAEASGRLPGRFVAWFSSVAAPAPSRLVDATGQPVNGPWFRVDGMRIVASRSALVGTASTPLENPINLSASRVKSGGGVWTGTRSDGSVGTLCPTGATPTTGIAADVGPTWTDQKVFDAKCGDTLLLYCFQVD